jgi:RNA polymerase sigma factor (TIGR02999 family)
LTQLLNRLGEAHSRDSADWERLFDLVYSELHRLADLLLFRSEGDRTLGPTVLVHEAYVHMGGSENISWESRAHFFGIAAHAMRQVLARYSERARAEKRGAGWERITLHGSLGRPDHQFEFVELHAVLEKLANEHERMAQVSELKIFAGMSSRECAEFLGVSKRTVETDWSLAKKWIARELV